MFGDYQLLCHLYGLSGASGILQTEYVIQFIFNRLPLCLWCSIKTDELSISKSSRQTQLRSLDTLTAKQKYSRSVIKSYAKNYYCCSYSA